MSRSNMSRSASGQLKKTSLSRRTHSNGNFPRHLEISAHAICHRKNARKDAEMAQMRQFLEFLQEKHRKELLAIELGQYKEIREKRVMKRMRRSRKNIVRRGNEVIGSLQGQLERLKAQHERLKKERAISGKNSKRYQKFAIKNYKDGVQKVKDFKQSVAHMLQSQGCKHVPWTDPPVQPLFAPRQTQSNQVASSSVQPTVTTPQPDTVPMELNPQPATNPASSLSSFEPVQHPQVTWSSSTQPSLSSGMNWEPTSQPQTWSSSGSQSTASSSTQATFSLPAQNSVAPNISPARWGFLIAARNAAQLAASHSGQVASNMMGTNTVPSSSNTALHNGQGLQNQNAAGASTHGSSFVLPAAASQNNSILAVNGANPNAASSSSSGTPPNLQQSSTAGPSTAPSSTPEPAPSSSPAAALSITASDDSTSATSSPAISNSAQPSSNSKGKQRVQSAPSLASAIESGSSSGSSSGQSQEVSQPPRTVMAVKEKTLPAKNGVKRIAENDSPRPKKLVASEEGRTAVVIAASTEQPAAENQVVDSTMADTGPSKPTPKLRKVNPLMGKDGAETSAIVLDWLKESLVPEVDRWLNGHDQDVENLAAMESKCKYLEGWLKQKQILQKPNDIAEVLRETGVSVFAAKLLRYSRLPGIVLSPSLTQWANLIDAQLKGLVDRQSWEGRDSFKYQSLYQAQAAKPGQPESGEGKKAISVEAASAEVTRWVNGSMRPVLQYWEQFGCGAGVDVLQCQVITATFSDIEEWCIAEGLGEDGLPKNGGEDRENTLYRSTSALVDFGVDLMNYIDRHRPTGGYPNAHPLIFTEMTAEALREWRQDNS